MTQTGPSSDNNRAALLMVAAMAGFAIEDVFLKRVAMVLPPGEVLVINGVLGGALFAAAAYYKGERVFSLDAFRGAPLIRNASEAVSALLYIYALAIAPLVMASALLQASPLIVTAGAALFLGETVGWRRWLSIIAGFIGVLIILEPWKQGFDPAGLAMLGCVITLAARDLVTRRMPVRIGTMSLSAWGFASIAPAGLVLMMIQGQSFVLPAQGQAMDLAMALITGVLGYYAVVAAMRIGEVSAIAPFRYARLVFASSLGILVLGESLATNVVIGSAVVVGSGLYVFGRERARQAAKARAAK